MVCYVVLLSADNDFPQELHNALKQHPLKCVMIAKGFTIAKSEWKKYHSLQQFIVVYYLRFTRAFRSDSTSKAAFLYV